MTRKKKQPLSSRSYAMLIDAHGNRISLRRFYLLLALALVIALGAMTIAGILAYRDYKRQATANTLHAEIARMQKQLEVATNDVELLSAQIVFLNPEMAPPQPKPKNAPPPKALPKESKPAPQPKQKKVKPPPTPPTPAVPEPKPAVLQSKPAVSQQAVSQAPPGAVGTPDTTPQSDSPGPALGVSEARPQPVAASTRVQTGEDVQTPDLVPGMAGVDKFNASAQGDRLQVRFNIINHRSREGRIGGYLFCVIKGAQVDPQKWLVLPGGTLQNGMPADVRRGYSFSIINFRTIRMKTPPLDPAVGYNQAQVWVYSKAGSLLFSRSYPLNLAASRSTRQP